MRNTFANHITKIAQEDKRINLLVGDIGFKVFDEFALKNASQFINMGIAESNMIGVAAGMAMVDLKPVVYTIIPFLTMRPFEQIRVDLCLHNLPVILVGVGGGLVYDTLGPTHHALEDVALMRSLPNMNVFTPSDPNEVKKSFDNALKLKSPSYIRLGKGGEKSTKDLLLESNFDPQSQIKYSNFNKVISQKKSKKLVLTYGPIISNCIKAISFSKNKVDLISTLTLKPFNEKKFIDLIKDYNEIICVEEHSYIGGLTDIISLIIAKNSIKINFKFAAINDKFLKIIGDREFLLSKNKLDPISLKNLFDK